MPSAALQRFIFAAVGLSGASALVFEVVWTRTLSTVMGSSTYALSTMLAAFMAGLSVGGGLGAIVSRRLRDPVRAFALCELGIGLAGLAVAPLMRNLTPLYIAAYYAFHESFAAFYAVQFAIAFALMAIPTVLMGVTFPLVVRLFVEWKGEAGPTAGRVYAVNTLGGIAGALAAGFLLVPLVGVTRTAAIAAAVNIANGLVILAWTRRNRAVAVGAAATGAAYFLLWAVPVPAAPTFSYGYAGRFGTAAFAERVASQGPGAEVVFHDEGIDGEVWLIRGSGPAGELALVNGSRLEGGDSPSFRSLARLPWATAQLSRPPRRALSIGLGSGHTLRELSATSLEAIDSVEISGGILEANRRFLSPDLFADPRIRHHRADGRNHLLVHGDLYDLIVVSPSWAVEEASAAMLTRQFFAIAAHHLTPDGAVGVWVDFTLMDSDDMSRVLRAFASVFRHVTGWRVGGGDVVLVGSNVERYPPEEAIADLAAGGAPEGSRGFSLALGDAAPRPGNLQEMHDDDLPSVEFNNARNLVVGSVRDGHGG